MTEEDARKRWCPFSSTGYVGVSLNRISGVDRQDHAAAISHDTRCVAAHCMAWRWHPHRKNEGSRSGFCGLAGNEVSP